jgi:hypothetical protein
MTTSGTTAFGLAGSDLLLEAFERLLIRASEITPDHVVSARRSMNLVQARWANRGTNLWKVSPTQSPLTIPLSQGVATYDLPSSTVMLLDCCRRVTPAGSDPIDTILTPVSRTDYATYPDKGAQGTPTVYLFDRQSTQPTVTLWQVPDNGGPYEFLAYTVSQLQDANPLASQGLDIPYRFSEALCADLALHLARKFPPKPDSGITIADLKLAAQEAWEEAAVEDRERVSMFVVPDFSSYFR